MRRRSFNVRLLIIAIILSTVIYTVIILQRQMSILQQHKGCKMPPSWRPNTIDVNTMSDFNDWSFRRTVQCPELNITNHPFRRASISLYCEGAVPSIVRKQPHFDAGVFEIPFGDQCLSDVIDNCCKDESVVPNIVHYVWFSNTKMNFFHFLSFMSAVKFINPCFILIHGPFVPYGKYWDFFMHMYPSVIHVKRSPPTSVAGNQLAYPEHGSDVMRIEALQVYGGIYLDWDEVVLRSVDIFRNYETTMGIEIEGALGSQFIMAKKNAKFLSMWYESYETDYKTIWSYNALRVPFMIYKLLPDIIHVHGHSFTRPDWSHRHQIFRSNYNWSENYALHFFSRWYYGIYNETTMKQMNTTLGSIARHILFGNKELCK